MLQALSRSQPLIWSSSEIWFGFRQQSSFRVDMRWVAMGFGIAGWLCSCVSSLSPAIAQSVQPCNITASAPSPLIPAALNSFGAMPKSIQSAESSSFGFSCPGNASRSGSLRLSISSSNTYNGIPQFRVSGVSGIFTSPSNAYGNSFTIPFSASGSTQSGIVSYQILVAAPNGQVLRAAIDYRVTILAELL